LKLLCISVILLPTEFRFVEILATGVEKLAAGRFRLPLIRLVRDLPKQLGTQTRTEGEDHPWLFRRPRNDQAANGQIRQAPGVRFGPVSYSDCIASGDGGPQLCSTSLCDPVSP